jgi:hypothetical protein
MVATAVLVTPQDAAAVLGISRQAVLKQWSLLEASGQGVMVEGKRKVQADGLIRLWIAHVRVGQTWERLVRVSKAMGADAEAKQLSVGGLDSLAHMIDSLVVLPHLGVDLEALTMGPSEAQMRPLAEVWAAIGRDLAGMNERFPGRTWFEPETGMVIGPDEQPLGVLWKEVSSLFDLGELVGECLEDPLERPSY